MSSALRLGVGRRTISVPGFVWRTAIRAAAGDARKSLRFMTEDHHRVRDFCVLELARTGAPLPPSRIANELGLDGDRVETILASLEKRLLYVYRSRGTDVTWAYPITVDETPHRAKLGGGTQAYSPWAVDTFAMPFVQGQLTNEPATVSFETQCACCGEPFRIDIDDELTYSVFDATEPLVLMPLVNFKKVKAPSIVDVFWRKSVFFWSEEHARKHRAAAGGDTGVYLTTGQAAYLTPIMQSGVFGFPRDSTAAV